MKLNLLLGALLASYSGITLSSTMNFPMEIKGSWNNGSELIMQSHNRTKLTIYINNKQRGPFEGTYFRYHNGVHLISVNFPDDPGCCTGRVENGGNTIHWSNNSAWAKDVVSTAPVIPPPLPASPNASKVTYHDAVIRVGSYRLDWCLKRGTQCGKPTADAWCELNNKTKLSSHATAFKQAVDLGRYTPTYILGDKSLCHTVGCDGFESITCELYGD